VHFAKATTEWVKLVAENATAGTPAMRDDDVQPGLVYEAGSKLEPPEGRVHTPPMLQTITDTVDAEPLVDV
jgi:hypothetical protein